MTGGVGREEIRAFYAERFIPQMPEDAEIELVSRTVGLNSIVDEFIFKCTHSRTMDFFLPGIAPTGRRIEVPHVAIIQFRDGLIESEHIYWDQASVLVQVGLLKDKDLPVAGAEPRPEASIERSDYALKWARSIPCENSLLAV
jgi:carboxymethylenebutenolidase